MTGSKKFERIGGMPIALQVWLYECSSSTNLKIARKVGDRIPRLLNWETIEAKPRYNKLMKGIFSDSNNKFRNITPFPRELVVLQLPPEGFQNQVEENKLDSSDDESDATSSSKKDSDDDFQNPPPSAKKNKRKDKFVSSSLPVKKRMKQHCSDVDDQSAHKIEPRLAKKPLVIKIQPPNILIKN